MDDYLKIRAWDTRHKKYFEVESLHQDQVDYVDDGKTEFDKYMPMYGYQSRGEVEIDICSGVKDKNENIMFKKDIIKNLEGETGVVDFQCGAFLIYYQKDNEGNIPFEYFDSNDTNYEIIGNLNENPELLKEK